MEKINWRRTYTVLSRIMDKGILVGFVIVDNFSGNVNYVSLERLKHTNENYGSYMIFTNARYDNAFNSLVGTTVSLTEYPEISTSKVVTAKKGIIVTKVIIDADTKDQIGVVCYNGLGTRYDFSFKKLMELTKKYRCVNFKLYKSKRYGLMVKDKNGGKFETIELKVRKQQSLMYNSELGDEAPPERASEFIDTLRDVLPMMKIYNIDTINTSDFSNDAQQKLFIASMNMSKLTPYYHCCLQAIRRRPVLGLGTLGVTEDTLLYDMEFVATKSTSELTFILIHEVCHIAMQHSVRFPPRKNHELWNTACDLYINSIICRDFGIHYGDEEKNFGTTEAPIVIKTPEDGIFLETINETLDLARDTPETIYDKLLAENKKRRGKSRLQEQNNDEEDDENQDNSSGGGLSIPLGGSGRSKKQQGQDQQNPSQSEQGDGNGQGQGQSTGQDGDEEEERGKGQGDGKGKEKDQNGQEDGQGQGGNGQGKDEKDQNGQDKGQGGNGQGEDEKGDGQDKGQGDKGDLPEDGDIFGGENEGSFGDSSDLDNELDGENKPCVRQVSVTYNGKKLTGKVAMDVMTNNQSKSDDARDDNLAKSKNALQKIQTKKAILEGETGEPLLKNAGDAGALVQRYINFGLSQQLDWKQLLKNIAAIKHKKTFTLASPNKDYMNMGMTIADRRPIGKPKDIGRIKICIDVSGSVSKADLDMYLSEVNSLLSKYKVEGELIYWSTCVGAAGEFKQMRDLLKINPITTGGTDVKPLFDYLAGKVEVDGKRERTKVKDIAGVFILTDGYFSKDYAEYREFFDKKTVWIIDGNPVTFDPCFGRVVGFNKEGD